MVVFAVVPVKELGTAKKRLSSILNHEERKLFAAAMLDDVLRALKSSIIHETVVVSNDVFVQKSCEKFGFSYVSQNRPGLNQAINEATEWCVDRKASAVLVLPSDIPLISVENIEKIVELGSNESTVVLSPSSNGGTNALFRNPPNLIQPCFGQDSFFEHIQEAFAEKVCLRFYYSIETATDIDSAEDLKKLLNIKNASKSRELLEKLLKQKPKLGTRGF
jgi:2-phospho-L-lactate guanylyltransferase